MKKYIFIATALGVTVANASTINGFEANFYGFIKASTTYSTEGLASYNNINLTAPTHATAQTRSQDSTSRLSFQTQQSRAGVTLKKGENISGHLEFDFVDFNKSSPTTQMNPRVRIASVTYAWENHKIIIGQDWDLYAPVNTYTFDIVGLYFMGGNTGFQRQQVQYLNTQGDWEFGGALGMAGNNPGTTDTDLELAKSPTYALRVSHKMGNGRVGLSGIYSHLSYATTDHSSHDAYAANAFYENTQGRLGLKSEIYYGLNLSNIGSLAIGKGTATQDVKEFGGFLTGNYQLTDKNFIFAGVGLAKVDNRSEIAPFSLSATNTISTPGIAQNTIYRVGWEYRVTEDFSWVSELSQYETKSKIADNNYQLNVVYGLETGVQLRF